jgi:predicted nucleic acid-binding protein
MITTVFDCMIFLQAATNVRGPGFACVSLAEANVVTLYVTPVILAEVRDVLARPKI